MSVLLTGFRTSLSFVEHVVAFLQVKADKIVANAKEEAIRAKAHAAEVCEKGIADSHSQTERVRLLSSKSPIFFTVLRL